MNKAEYNINVPIIISISVIKMSGLSNSGLLISKYTNNIIAMIDLPTLSNDMFDPSTCNIIFLGRTNILSNSPFPEYFVKSIKCSKKTF